VLLDMTMPGRDGLETCRAIKANPDTAPIPIIFVTGHSDSEHIVRAFSAGGSDYVTKPIRIDELLARITVQLRLREAEKNLVERNGQLEGLTSQLAEMNAELARQARVDSLTRLLNRNTWNQAAEAEHERAVRHERVYSILMLDVDYFKLLNDSQGHRAGDDCLRALSAAIAGACRKSDVAGRYGGEEFVVLAPETRAEAAILLAERIRQAIWDLSLPHPASPAGRVTVSIGVAEFELGSLSDAMGRADKALYLAKRSGRNLVYGRHAALPDHTEIREASEPSIPSVGEVDTRSVILVVEDNATNRRLYRGCLGAEEYRNVEAEDGLAGLAAVKRELPDVILMDVSMPGMDGLECTRRIKADPETRDIPLIIVSARHDAADVLAGIKAGADEYLSKPIRTTELAARVRSMARLSRERKDLVRSYRLRAEQIRVLSMLLDFCRSMGAAASTEEVLDQMMAAVAEITGGRTITVMQPNPERTTLNIVRHWGADGGSASPTSMAISTSLAGAVYQTGQPIIVNSESDAKKYRDDGAPQALECIPLLLTPLGNQARTLRVLCITDRVGRTPFESRELEYVELVTNIAGSALDAAHDRQDRDEARDMIVVALAKLAEHRDSDTARHVERVTRYAILLAGHLRQREAYRSQIDDRFLHDLERAVSLHDIGKVAIPDSILRKPGRLSVQEMAIMRSHADIGADTLRPIMEKGRNIEFLKMAVDIIQSHHEWYDGSGYPQGLKGHEIPLAALIVGVADVYDALTTERVYKRAISPEEAESIIVQSSGTQFAPILVEAFLSCKDQFRALAEELADAPSVSLKEPSADSVRCPVGVG